MVRRQWPPPSSVNRSTLEPDPRRSDPSGSRADRRLRKPPGDREDSAQNPPRTHDTPAADREPSGAGRNAFIGSLAEREQFTVQNRPLNRVHGTASTEPHSWKRLHATCSGRLTTAGSSNQSRWLRERDDQTWQK